MSDDAVNTSRLISQAMYARHRQVTRAAVSKAIAVGRLRESLVMVNGRRMIRDFASADAEWRSNTNALKAPSHLELEVTEPNGTGQAGDLVSVDTLVDAQRYATLERARKIRMENDVTEGRLVPVDEVAKEAGESARVIREAFLNLPSRLAGELAAETDTGKIHMRLELAIRECLTAGADAVQGRAARA